MQGGEQCSSIGTSTSKDYAIPSEIVYFSVSTLKNIVLTGFSGIGRVEKPGDARSAALNSNFSIS
jgi:hypothetical protein